MKEIAGQLVLPEPEQPSPRIRRALRHGPRTRRVRHPRGRPMPEDTPVKALAEWHEMTPGQQLAAWAGLRAWVTWLHDRYELSADDRLPRCWPDHPGLVEELYALKAWREEIYTAAQPSGQAARYWHSELRQVLHAATTVYAAGCRTGHRAAPAAVGTDTALQARWAQVSPLTAIPATDLAAGHARIAGTGWADHTAMAQALDTGGAYPIPELIPDGIADADAVWTPAANGWLRTDTGIDK